MKWHVQIPIAGSITIDVDAPNAAAAKEAAWDRLNAHEGDAEDIGEIEWEFFDEIASGGGVCHAPCNAVCASKARS